MNGYESFVKGYNLMEFVPKRVQYIGTASNGYREWDIPYRPKKCTPGMTVEDLAPLIKKGIAFYAGESELGLKRGGRCYLEGIYIEFDILDEDGELLVTEADNLLDYGSSSEIYDNPLKYLKDMEQYNLQEWRNYIPGEAVPSAAPTYRQEIFR
jgi:hypothetical protein